MKDYTTIAKLYYLLIMADDHINEKEVTLGKKMAKIEGLDYATFQNTVNSLKGNDKDKLFDDVVTKLITFNRTIQINWIAWMSLIANSDGFMDKREWDLIYRIYKKHLNLNLDEIMKRQRELAHLIHSNLHTA